MPRRPTLLPLALLASACMVHAPEEVAGPDEILVREGTLSGPVTIHEDAWGIPHIQAGSLEDALFALGTLHAEERFFQMDVSRRIGEGRLSPLFGKRTIDADRFLRTLGMEGAAASMLDGLSDEARRGLDAYTAGVNDALARMDRPPEYRLLRARPEPWRPIDSLVWTKVMSLNLSGDMDWEARRHRLAKAVGPELAQRLMPARTYPEDAPTIIESAPTLARPDPEPASAPESEPVREPEAEPVRDPAPEPEPERGPEPAPEPDGPAGMALAMALIGHGPGVGSNNWVLHGSHTTTGAPLLASDPHLGVSMPSVWYLAEIDTPELHVIGSTLPGVPGVLLGHSEHMAWGITTGYIDTQDLFFEKLDGSTPIARREETIEVKGGKDVTLVVQESPRGPLMHEFLKLDEPVSLAWAQLEPQDRSLDAFLAIARAKNVTEFREALRSYDAAPQNFVFADREGNIGYQLATRAPRRGQRDWHAIARGWEEADQWDGWVPLDDLPGVINPERGRVVTANNAQVPQGSEADLGYFADAPYRAARIVERLDEQDRWSTQDTRELQLDVLSTQTRDTLPFLTALTTSDPQATKAVAMLRSWDRRVEVESGAAALYEVWLTTYVKALSEDILPPEARDISLPAVHLVRGTLHDGTLADQCRPDCAALAERTLAAAYGELRERLGEDPAAWRWGDLHPISFHHRLGVTRGLRRKLDASAPSPGDRFTVNVGSHGSDYVQRGMASYRQVVDLSDWDQSTWIFAPGQSGAFWRAHYRDLVDAHIANEQLPMLFGATAREQAVRVRTIQPRQG